MASAQAIAPSVLGIDTATADVAVALTADRATLSERSAPPPASGRPRHSESLLAEIEAAVSEAGGWERVALIAVGVGPGTFTGLRVGVATARAIAQARRLELAPVSSLAALARGIGPGGDRPRLALIDARRGELFAALFEDDRERWPPFAASPEDLIARVRQGGFVPLAAGDGSLRFREMLEEAGIAVEPEDSEAHVVPALHICRLGGSVRDEQPEAVLPEYLREPDAKPRQ
jgi:tRNA threonylcarbamoyladenosine biosynthesis protein TsaB